MLVGRGGHVHRALNGRIARGPSDERLRVPGFFQLGDAGAPDVDGHIDITRYQGVCPRHLIHNRKYLELIDIRLSRLPVFRAWKSVYSGKSGEERVDLGGGGNI